MIILGGTVGFISAWWLLASVHLRLIALPQVFQRTKQKLHCLPIPRLRSRTRFIMCGAQCEMKMWVPCSKILRNFTIETEEHGIFLSIGPLWLHRSLNRESHIMLLSPYAIGEPVTMVDQAQAEGTQNPPFKDRSIRHFADVC